MTPSHVNYVLVQTALRPVPNLTLTRQESHGGAARYVTAGSLQSLLGGKAHRAEEGIPPPNPFPPVQRRLSYIPQSGVGGAPPTLETLASLLIPGPLGQLNNTMAATTSTVSQETRRLLESLKIGGATYDEVIRSLLIANPTRLTMAELARRIREGQPHAIEDLISQSRKPRR